MRKAGDSQLGWAKAVLSSLFPNLWLVISLIHGKASVDFAKANMGYQISNHVQLLAEFTSE